MPSGAYVTVQLWPWPNQPSRYYMDVIVYPLSEDRNQGSGLCGNYNNDPNDDLTLPGSTYLDNSQTMIYGSLQHEPLLFPPSYQ